MLDYIAEMKMIPGMYIFWSILFLVFLNVCQFLFRNTFVVSRVIRNQYEP